MRGLSDVGRLRGQAFRELDPRGRERPALGPRRERHDDGRGAGAQCTPTRQLVTTMGKDFVNSSNSAGIIKTQ